MARDLPPLDEKWPLLTPRGELAIRVATALRGDWMEDEVAETLGISLGRVRRLRTRANEIGFRLAERRFRSCVVCGLQLAVDARSDARYCLTPSTCRRTGRRREIRSLR